MILQRFHSIGPISVEDARIFMVLIIFVAAVGFVLLKYGNVIRKFREWHRARTRVPFEMLSAEKRLELFKNLYCFRCGSIETMLAPVEVIDKGEYVVRGKCPKCGDTVDIRK